MTCAYPIMLDVRERAVLVIGGGGVAERKVRALLDAGATAVTVLASDIQADLPQGVRRIIADYHQSHLDGADLVFAATNVRAVNDAIVRDCRARRLWVNRADADDLLPGDFATPAQLRKGPVTVTVAAGSAALSAAIRDRLGQEWDQRWTSMAIAMRQIRPMIVAAQHLPPNQRADMLRFLASEAALSLVAAEGAEALSAWVRAQIEAPKSLDANLELNDTNDTKEVER